MQRPLRRCHQPYPMAKEGATEQLPNIRRKTDQTPTCDSPVGEATLLEDLTVLGHNDTVAVTLVIIDSHVRLHGAPPSLGGCVQQHPNEPSGGAPCIHAISVEKTTACRCFFGLPPASVGGKQQLGPGRVLSFQ